MIFHPCIVVPVFNHAAEAVTLIGKLSEFALPVIVVDDGGTAECARELDALGKLHSWVRVLRHPANLGKGGAVLTALRHARSRGFSHALQIDADGQHAVGDVARFLAAAAKNPEALIAGSPIFDASAPRSRRHARHISNVWVRIETLSFTIRDSLCGFRIYPLAPVLSLADRVRLGRRMDFDPELLVRLSWEDVPIVWLPTVVVYPEGGRSNFRLWRDNWLITKMHTRLVLGMIWRLPHLISRHLEHRATREDPGPSRGMEGGARHWATLKERGPALGPRLMLEAYRHFGRTAFSLLLYPVMAYFLVANGAARRASLDFLSRVHAHPRRRTMPPGTPGWAQAFRHFLGFGDALLDKLAAWTGDIALSQVIYHNREIFAELQQSGRGGLLIGSHLGNLEACRALGSLHQGLKINVVVHTRHAEAFNRLLHRMNPASIVALIQAGDIGPDTIIVLREKVARGEIIVVTGDRTPVGSSHRVSRVPFLGGLASFPQGPFILAALLNCPVQLIFCVKRDKHFHISFEPFADALTLPRQQRERAIEGWISRYTARLEDRCLQDPYQWFNFYDFWAPPAETAAAEGVARAGTLASVERPR